MQPDPVAEGRRWLDQARQDLSDARYLREGDRHNLACFHSQQAAEKALKAFLVLRELEDVWGHSVAELCERAAVFDPAFADLERDGAKLDRLYVPTRYPNGLPGGLPAKAFDREDADAGIERATAILDAVTEAFGGE